jgi:type VI secretion system secreted protein VgrG
MEGFEEISRPFEYQVLAVARPADAIVFDDLLGKPASVAVTVATKPVRHYHGVIASVGFVGKSGSNRAWRLTLRPWLWLLTRSRNVRIFQKMTVPEILNKVLSAYGGNFQVQLQGTYRKREYCVQYRETDFDFVSRLMEDEGIFYFFRHEAARHTMVIADDGSAHVPMQSLARLPWRDTEQGEESIGAWRWGQELQTTGFLVRDHAMEQPGQNFEKEAKVTRRHTHGTLQSYDWPAGLAPYAEGDLSKLPDDAAHAARVRIDALQAHFELAHAETNSVNVCAGARLALAEHPVGEQNREYVVLATRVKMSVGGVEAGTASQASHTCDFTAMPAQQPFRPLPSTPKPVVAGPQTATVVGPSGEELFVDKHGRVKVQFHWDREGKKDQGSSCFVRVAQPAAGKGFGFVALPRIGQEVVVEFLEGDPDRPLITGAVYNGQNVPPYTLPDHKAVSTMKTRSTTGGGARDFNELRFDDTKGSEYLLMQAQKNRLEFVKDSQRVQIDKDLHHTVKQDRFEKVEGELHLTVAKDVRHKLDGKFSLKVADDVLVASNGLHALKAAKDITAEAGTAYSIKAGTDLHVKAGQNAGVDAGMNVHLKGGMNVVVEAGMQLTLKAGAGSIVIGPDGVSITGPMVKVNSGGAAGSGNGASPVVPTAPEEAKAPELPEDPLSHV